MKIRFELRETISGEATHYLTKVIERDHVPEQGAAVRVLGNLRQIYRVVENLDSDSVDVFVGNNAWSERLADEGHAYIEKLKADGWKEETTP